VSQSQHQSIAEWQAAQKVDRVGRDDRPEDNDRAAWNKAAIAAFVLAVLLPPIGAFTGIAVVSRLPDQRRGSGLAAAAILVGAVLTVFCVMFLVDLAATHDSGGVPNPH
jgi:hypothetical protein